MRPAHPPPVGGAFSRRFTAYSGIFFDEFATDSAWLRETGSVRLPPLDGVRNLVVRGEYRPHPDARGVETGAPGLQAFVNGHPAGSITHLRPGPWELRVTLTADPATLTFR